MKMMKGLPLLNGSGRIVTVAWNSNVPDDWKKALLVLLYKGKETKI